MSRHAGEGEEVDEVTLAGMLSLMPFALTLGIRLEKAGPQEVIGVLPLADTLATAGGIMHGGALMALADSVGGICAYLNLSPGYTTATANSSTNFVRPVRKGVARAVSMPLYVGRTMIVVQTDVLDNYGQLAARVNQTQTVRPERS